MFRSGGRWTRKLWDILKVHGKLESVNIDPQMAPDIVADLNHKLDLESNSYDTVISFNTFEHIQKDVDALAEFLRVLKPGGEFHIVVPFLYRVHGAPSDYHRHTHHEWMRRISELAVANQSIEIRAIVWDPIASGYSMFEYAFPRLRWFLRPAFLLPGLIYQIIKKPSHGWLDYALGYYISGRK